MPAGFRANAVEAVLVHESPRRGDLVIHAGRLRDGLPNDLDSGEILALRMGRTDTLPELQMSATGRLSSGGANRPCNRILETNAPNLREELDCHTFVYLYVRFVVADIRNTVQAIGVAARHCCDEFQKFKFLVEILKQVLSVCLLISRKYSNARHRRISICNNILKFHCVHFPPNLSLFV